MRSDNYIPMFDIEHILGIRIMPSGLRRISLIFSFESHAIFSTERTWILPKVLADFKLRLTKLTKFDSVLYVTTPTLVNEIVDSWGTMKVIIDCKRIDEVRVDTVMCPKMWGSVSS